MINIYTTNNQPMKETKIVKAYKEGARQERLRLKKEIENFRKDNLSQIGTFLNEEYPKGYNRAIRDVLALLDDTPQKGKEEK